MTTLDTHILPIYVFPKPTVEGADTRPLRFAGTGFVVAPYIFVTCAHCVPELHQDESYGAVVDDETVYILNLITYDPSGADLATAHIGVSTTPPYRIRIEPPTEVLGLEVGTLGYAGTLGTLRPDGVLQFEQHGRWLGGYVTQAFNYTRPDGRRIPTYEVDMPAPQGVSGSPLITRRIDTSGYMEVIGVVYGAHPPFGTGAASAGDIALPPYVFALAHYHSTLLELRGAATGDKPLKSFLSS